MRVTEKEAEKREEEGEAERGGEKEGGASEQRKHLPESERCCRSGSKGNGLFQLKVPLKRAHRLFFWLQRTWEILVTKCRRNSKGGNRLLRPVLSSRLRLFPCLSFS